MRTLFPHGQPDNPLDAAIASCRPLMSTLLGFSFVYNILLLILPIYSLQVFDRVLSSSSLETLLFLSILSAGAFLFLGLFGAIRSLILSKLGEWVDITLTPVVVQNMLDMAVLTSGISGSQNNRDLMKIRQFISGNGIVSLLDAPWALLFIAAVFFIHVYLGILLLVGGIILLGLTYINQLAIHESLAQVNKDTNAAMQKLEQAARHVDTIKAMGMEKDFIQRWVAQNQPSIVLQSQVSTRSAIILSMSRVVRMILQLGIIGGGAWLALIHQATSGGIIAASILSARALAPFEQSIGIWSTLEGAVDAFKRLRKQFEQTPKHAETIILPEPKGYLQIENVSYIARSKNLTILKNIHFSLQPGESLGIIGPSAAGKSTLARLLVGIITPTIGHVRLDEADVTQWDRQQIGRYIGYMPQDVGLFEGTVKDNISRMQKNVPDEAIIHAAHIAGVHELILHLPDGYETMIGPNGTLLSAGQRQRIGLARAFLYSPRLIVLDEPNANLDGEGEEALIHAIARARHAGATLAVISHRPRLLTSMDTILVLSKGSIANYGPARDILSRLSSKSAAQTLQAAV